MTRVNNKIKQTLNYTTILLLSFVLLLSFLAGGSYAWFNKTDKLNKFINQQDEKTEKYQVILTKYQKNTDPQDSITIEGTEFYLFKEDDSQVGNKAYYTDNNGQIIIENLEEGDYYFKETQSIFPYTYDVNETGSNIYRYYFTISKDIADENNIIYVKAYNRLLAGSLVITKTVKNGDSSSLTSQDLLKEFEFKVSFSDNGSYKYRINDGEVNILNSEETILLKHGEVAVFEDIPLRTKYLVEEVSSDGYLVSSNNHYGDILGENSLVSFTNTVQSNSGSLLVSKTVENSDGTNLSDEQKEKEFEFSISFENLASEEFTILIGENYYDVSTVNKEFTFSLKSLEEIRIKNIPLDIEYKVSEKDESSEKYTATVNEYQGKIVREDSLIHLPFVNIFGEEENIESGDLIISKKVVGNNPVENQEFEFVITFEGDDSINSPQSFTLKDGESISFDGLPKGLKYQIIEKETSGYSASTNQIKGFIVAEKKAQVEFINYQDRVTKTSLIIEKVGEGIDFDFDKVFEFTVYINGVALEDKIGLKAGEQSTPIELQVGDNYQVIEDDYTADNYYRNSITNGSGTATEEIIRVVQTNFFNKMETIIISGEKTWNLNGNNVVILEEITINIMNGDLVVDSTIVTPNSEGNWFYEFEVLKYDENGILINYTVKEDIISGWIAEVDGYDIVNISVKPVIGDPIIIRKVVAGDIPFKDSNFVFTMTALDGGPMPVGIVGNQMSLTITGEGVVDFGIMEFITPGVYHYRISEKNDGVKGYTYDKTVYTLIYDIRIENGNLIIESFKIVINDEEQDDIIFINVFENAIKPDNPFTGDEGNWKATAIFILFTLLGSLLVLVLKKKEELKK